MKFDRLFKPGRWIGLFLTVLLAVSCVELDENPPSDLSSSNFAVSDEELNLLLTGAAKSLFTDWNGFDYGYDLILASGAEDLRSNADIFKDFDLLTPNDRETVILGFWKQSYKCISNVNTLIAGLPKFADGNDPRKAKYELVEGQARFLRAFSYFYLVRFFGPVQVTTFENQNKVETVPQSTVQEVYDAIVADLTTAEQELPISFGEKGKPTRGAAKALLAKVYLTMAGWPLNDKSKYAKAKEKAGEVMGGDYGYDLEPNYADLWKQAKKLTSKEFIFTFYGSVAQQGVAGSHMNLATRFWGNGEGGWGDYFSETRFFNAFPAGPRKDATFTSVFADGTTFSQAGVEPYIAKYRDGGNTVGTNSEGFRPMIRFADVLLIYAEAANYVNNGPTPEAINALNRVRVRAGLDPYPRGLSFEEFDRAVIEERAWEFACEGDRWHDLVRREMVVSANADRFPNLSANVRLLPKPGTEIIPGILEQNPK